MTRTIKSGSQIKILFHLQFKAILYIRKAYLKDNFMIDRLKNIWSIGASSEKHEPNLTRRGALRALMGGAAALAFVALPGGNVVQAQDRQTAGLSAGERGLNAVQGRRDMRLFSEDVEKQGIGVFINLQADAPADGGDTLGEWVQRQFSGVQPPIPVEYRVNRSRGTATDLTFYVRGVGTPLNMAELRARLPEIYNDYKGAWLPETTALAPEVSRQ